MFTIDHSRQASQAIWLYENVSSGQELEDSGSQICVILAFGGSFAALLQPCLDVSPHLVIWPKSISLILQVLMASNQDGALRKQQGGLLHQSLRMKRR